MRKWVQAILLFVLLSQIALAQSSFKRQTVTVGNMGFSLSNFGTIGNPLIVSNPNNDPSMEYPINSGIEHLFEGGLWIGAYLNGQKTVSTGAIDASGGYIAGAGGFEYCAPVGTDLIKRSTLTNSDNYSVDAVSHEDFICDFSDQYTIIPGTTIPITDHILPLGASVHMESYAWNYSFADYFVICNYTITNTSANVWDSVWIGFWTDLVVRNVNVATDNGAAYFNKGAGGFIDSCQAVYAFDVNGDPGYTNSYGATQILGLTWRDLLFMPSNAPNVISAGYPEPKVNANFWVFKQFTGTQYNSPADDLERYDKMKTGLNFNDEVVKETIQTPSNRTQLISVGPLEEMQPGETAEFAVAFVCARQKETGATTGPEMDTPFAQTELIEHLGWAKRTYNGEDLNGNGTLDSGEDLNANAQLDRYILPEPPLAPKVKVVSTENKVELYWEKKAEFSIDPISKEADFEGYRIYRSVVGEDLSNPDIINSAALLQQWDLPGNNIGYNNGIDIIALDNPVKFEGDTTTYYYRFTNDGLLNGWQYVYVITAFDRGDENLKISSLESSKTVNTFRVWPGTAGVSGTGDIGVYPNPYRLSAAWDGPTPFTRKMIFSKLPKRCTITIYTLSGDIITTLNHDESYNGNDIRWYSDYAGNENQRVFSGGEHAWDILSESNQTITQGIYMFSVKDLSTGQTKTGTFTVLK
jgi:hypothetical protein